MKRIARKGSLPKSCSSGSKGSVDHAAARAHQAASPASDREGRRMVGREPARRARRDPQRSPGRARCTGGTARSRHEGGELTISGSSPALPHASTLLPVLQGERYVPRDRRFLARKPGTRPLRVSCSKTLGRGGRGAGRYENETFSYASASGSSMPSVGNAREAASPCAVVNRQAPPSSRRKSSSAALSWATSRYSRSDGIAR